MLGEQVSERLGPSGRGWQELRKQVSLRQDFWKRAFLPTYFTTGQKREAQVGFLIFIHPDNLPLKKHNNIFIGIWSKRQCRETSSRAKLRSHLHTPNLYPPENWPRKSYENIHTPLRDKHVPLKNYSLQDCIFSSSLVWTASLSTFSFSPNGQINWNSDCQKNLSCKPFF